MANEGQIYSPCVSSKTDVAAGKSEVWLGTMGYAGYPRLQEVGMRIRLKESETTSLGCSTCCENPVYSSCPS